MHKIKFYVTKCKHGFALIAYVNKRNCYFYAIMENLKPRSWILAHNQIFQQTGYIPLQAEYIQKVPKTLVECTSGMYAYYHSYFSTTSDKDWKKHMTSIFEKKDECQNAKEFYLFIKNRVKELNMAFARETTDSDYEGFKQFSSITPFEYLEMRKVTVLCNVHVKIDGNYYSVPFSLRKEDLSAEISNHFISIYYEGNIVAVHERIQKDNSNKYTTDPEHMPNNNEIPFGEMSGTSLRSWAGKIGTNTYSLIDSMLKRSWCEQHSYISCELILMLNYKYTPSILEMACKYMIEHRYQPTVHNVQLCIEKIL